MDQTVAKKNNLMDTTRADRGIWLVKVPNYVAELWEKSPNDMQVATMSMRQSMDQQEPAKVKLVLSPELLKMAPDKFIASEHDLKLSDLAKDSRLTGVFTSTEDGQLAMEGWITHKVDCLPVCNDQYLQMKQQSIRGQKPSRSAEPLNHIVKNYKPVSQHEHNSEESKRRKEAALKGISKERLLDLVFRAFEQHQYYTLKDLQYITKQSMFMLRAVLKDIGDYNKDPAHKMMWELKKEYRHYAKPKSKSPTANPH